MTDKMMNWCGAILLCGILTAVIGVFANTALATHTGGPLRYGEDTTPEQEPWAGWVSVVFVTEDGRQREVIRSGDASGTLVCPNVVVTTGHFRAWAPIEEVPVGPPRMRQVTDRDLAFFRCATVGQCIDRLGRKPNDADQNLFARSLERVKHPTFDITVMKLDRNLTDIPYAKLPDDRLAGGNVRMTSYGLGEYLAALGRPRSAGIRRVGDLAFDRWNDHIMTIINGPHVERVVFPGRGLTFTTASAGNSLAPCPGDSGGGAFVNDLIYGVGSRVTWEGGVASPAGPCAQANLPRPVTTEFVSTAKGNHGVGDWVQRYMTRWCPATPHRRDDAPAAISGSPDQEPELEDNCGDLAQAFGCGIGDVTCTCDSTTILDQCAALKASGVPEGESCIAEPIPIETDVQCLMCDDDECIPCASIVDIVRRRAAASDQPKRATVIRSARAVTRAP